MSGTIVRWRLMGNASGGAFKLRVLRPAGGGHYTGVGTSSPMVPTGAGPSTFSTELPIKAGDEIGVDGPDSATWVGGLAPVAGSTYVVWLGVLADGSTSSPTFSNPGQEVGVNADVVPPPGVAAVGPASGPSSGGTRVVIRGHDFSGATAVSFGGTPAASFSVDSDGVITAVSPPAPAGTVDITVTTPGGTSPTSTADNFTYTPPTVTPRTVGCAVPRLKGDSVKKARKSLKAAHCTLGKVKKPRHHHGKLVVKSQSPAAGTVLANGASVSVKLGPKPHHKKHQHTLRPHSRSNGHSYQHASAVLGAFAAF